MMFLWVIWNCVHEAAGNHAVIVEKSTGLPLCTFTRPKITWYFPDLITPSTLGHLYITTSVQLLTLTANALL